MTDDIPVKAQTNINSLINELNIIKGVDYAQYILLNKNNNQYYAVLPLEHDEEHDGLRCYDYPLNLVYFTYIDSKYNCYTVYIYDGDRNAVGEAVSVNNEVLCANMLELSGECYCVTKAYEGFEHIEGFNNIYYNPKAFQKIKTEEPDIVLYIKKNYICGSIYFKLHNSDNYINCITGRSISENTMKDSIIIENAPGECFGFYSYRNDEDKLDTYPILSLNFLNYNPLYMEV